jgi:uncharacterized RDD family membrane protein YckC
VSTTIEQIDWNHWLWRLIAFIVDCIIVAIPTYIIWFILTFAIAFSSTSFVFISPFIFGLIEVLYFVVLDVSWGATIGKRIFGFQVQTVEGGKVPFDKAFIRNISKIYWIFLVLDWLIAIATPGKDRRQKFTDRFAGTTVVQTRQPFQSTAQPSPTPPPPPPPPPSA